MGRLGFEPREVSTEKQLPRLDQQIQEGEGLATAPESDAKCPNVPLRTNESDRGDGTGGGPDGVELALAEALREAASAGRFEVLPQLVGELEARRAARAGIPK